MLLNTKEDLEEQRENWISVFDDFVGAISNLKDMDIKFNVSKSVEAYHPILLELYWDEYYKEKIYMENFGKCADFLLNHQKIIYNIDKREEAMAIQIEKLTLENEALKSAVNSKKRRM